MTTVLMPISRSSRTTGSVPACPRPLWSGCFCCDWMTAAAPKSESPTTTRMTPMRVTMRATLAHGRGRRRALLAAVQEPRREHAADGAEQMPLPRDPVLGDEPAQQRRAPDDD